MNLARRILSAFEWAAAALLAFFLPFTSLPLVARLTGSSMVAPLSLLPVALLAAFWLAPFLLRKGRFPSHTRPLIAFAAFALVTSAAAFFRFYPAYKSSTLLNSEVKALLTLAIGLAFYLVVICWFHSEDRLRFLLRWVNWSGVPMLAWSFYQALIFFRLGGYPDWMWNFQADISTSALLYVQRVTGFAYEPSWLAHQLNMLYLPFWLAASVTGFSAHGPRFRLGFVTVERVLLVGGVAALLLSVSRIGLLTFLLMVAFLLLIWNIRLVRWLQNRVTVAQPVLDARGQAKARLTRRWAALGSALILLIIYMLLMLGAAYGLSRFDARMARLFDFTALKQQSFFHYANQLVFAERLVFWQAGWEVFDDHPIIGVGLGNAGYFFPEKLSAFSWALTEIRTLMYRQTALPNIKSLWVRLLAETGVIGFALFACWVIVLWYSAQFLRSRAYKMWSTVGLAGSFALIGFLIEGFSLDTFALPYYWVSFGVITSACEIARRHASRAADSGTKRIEMRGGN